MQGQRNSMEHFTDVFGFDIGSSSGNPVMDQQAYWNNVLGSVESQNLQGYQMNHSDATIPYGNEPQQDGTFLGFWESGEASSSGSALNFGSSSNAKTEHLNIGGGLRIGERRLVADNDLSLDVDINLNANANDLRGQSSNVNCASQGPEQYSGCDRNGLSSGSYDLNGGINNAGNSQRSFRARTTTAQQIAPCAVWPSSNAIRLSNSWNHQPPHPQSTFDDPQEVIPVVSSLNLQYQHPMNVPGVPQAANRFTGHGASSSRAGSLENRVVGSDEVLRRNVVPTSYSDLVPPAAVDLRRLVPEPSNWSSDGRGTAISGTIPPVSRANTSSTVNPPAGSTHQNLSRRHPRNLSEEIGRLSGALRGHQPPRLRSGFLLERQGDGVWGVPLSMRGREGRRLMEIRNALEMIHRGENVRLEELLALEERIGNVNTGLSEEAVIKLLKQRKFSSWRLKASLDHEPCCICQEEYVDGDDLGRLDCGHDFHAGCIKQWLVLKNVCPICKNTALKT
ncbi:putative E3 ubiquitin-protein ligase HIP1 [Panicum miliaceum]|uniref:RING-type E3 ubiquitin transferase n=1 Tax=Panicum miliaceum TaxID=4540 RepID=A0A3L6QAA2_PANMI|nr:putative E3 ubiquitin-protein ligase HIP1 [Panicum miliaceum]